MNRFISVVAAFLLTLVASSAFAAHWLHLYHCTVDFYNVKTNEFVVRQNFNISSSYSATIQIQRFGPEIYVSTSWVSNPETETAKLTGGLGVFAEVSGTVEQGLIETIGARGEVSCKRNTSNAFYLDQKQKPFTSAKDFSYNFQHAIKDACILPPTTVEEAAQDIRANTNFRDVRVVGNTVEITEMVPNCVKYVPGERGRECEEYGKTRAVKRAVEVCIDDTDPRS